MDSCIRIAMLQRELFRILDEFFQRATGPKPLEFATFDSFGAKVNSEAARLAQRSMSAFPYVYDALSDFYTKHGVELFTEAKNLSGLNFVLGGSSRFFQSQFDSVRKVALYADTTFIPDPILPWIEAPRAEERFRNVLFLETIFVLLHLKPLVDADLPYPAVVIFPSYEKSLENLDATTQQGINDLLLGILSGHLGRKFGNMQELVSFAASNESEFLRTVDDNHLFVAPNGGIGQPLGAALDDYLEVLKEWRSNEQVSTASKMSRSMLTLQGLAERIGPQYHLLENAEKLSSSPMVCLPSHWHYYCMACQFFEQRLKLRGLLDQATIDTVRAINQPEFRWLGNIPVDQLVTLRHNNENEEFRRQIKDRISELHGARLNDLNQITSEVSRSIASLLLDHQKQMAALEDKYQSKYRKIALGSWVTLAAMLVPALAPLVGVLAPFAIGGEYIHTKQSERKESAAAARSLMGVLAAANDPNGNE